MNIICFGYRDWATDIVLRITGWGRNNSVKVHFFMHRDEVEPALKLFNPDYVFFIGWSWLIPEHIVENYKCFCLHPSPLPKYRGGSPIQHQIMNGEKTSAVTIFRMTKGIDDGPIYAQQEFSLEGSLSNVFNAIAHAGIQCIEKMLNDFLAGKEVCYNQDESQATFFRRRKKEESKLTLENFQTWDSERMYNFIRALSDPYPNAYLEYPNGDKLLFGEVKLIKKE